MQEWYESPTIQVPVSILVNGKGRIGQNKHDYHEEELRKYLQGFGGEFFKVAVSPDETVDFETQYAQFRVRPERKYRFRILGLIGQNFPIRFSVDDHTFSAIAADSLYIREISKDNKRLKDRT